MNKATKSALLSALVFPGAGHFHLKKYRIAGVLIVTSLASIYVIAAEAIKQVQNTLKEIEATGVYAISPERITELATQAASNANTAETSFASTLILICWVVGIIDAYRSGKKVDKETSG